jgi:hypothetical protein
VIKDLKVVSNNNLIKINYSLKNDGVHSFSANASFESFAVLTKMWSYVTIRTPQDENDQNYQKQFMKALVNVEKAVKGIRSNAVTSKITDVFLKSSSRDLTFPLKKVI